MFYPFGRYYSHKVLRKTKDGQKHLVVYTGGLLDGKFKEVELKDDSVLQRD